MKTIFSSKFLPFFLAIPFIGIYFVVRSLPVEPCDFLHEETYNLEGESIIVDLEMQALLIYLSAGGL